MIVRSASAPCRPGCDGRLVRALALSLALVGVWIAVPVAAASGPEDRADVVVHLRGEATAAGVRKVLESAPGAMPDVRLPLVDAFAVRATPAQIRALAARTDVESVEPDRAATTLDVSS